MTMLPEQAMPIVLVEASPSKLLQLEQQCGDVVDVMHTVERNEVTNEAEYTIPRIGDSDSPHVKKANIPIEKGGYLIYGTSHMHTGVVNTTLYGQDGRVLCTSTPKYGTRKEAGNEKGYVVGMSGCYPKPAYSANGDSEDKHFSSEGSSCDVRRVGAAEGATKSKTLNVMPEQAPPIVMIEASPSKLLELEHQCGDVVGIMHIVRGNEVANEMEANKDGE
ncbi:hypothetical protein Fmac_026202 [Flemingia macrophylla]|uniref:Uncharacterized protein n=1 Tax=Flemingia macrophylla TaxID=520843 RepID=A0ABD1LE86_9FABA